MNWVNEKEEWLVDWSDAKCLKEISFEGAGSLAGQQPASEDQLDVFFSDAIEACGRCLVCRASGPTVEVFDISPTAESLLSWRVRLPSPVVPDIGIAYVQDADGTSLSIMFLTKAHAIHELRVLLHHPCPDAVAEGTIVCGLPSPPSCFCALDRGFAVVGCFDGTMHAWRAGQRLAAYELADLSTVRRLISGLVAPALPSVLALASLGRSEGSLLASGFLLLSFSADGKLRLWEALQNRSVLLASRAVLPAGQDPSVSLLGGSSAYLRVGRSRARACLVLRRSVFLVELAAGGGAEGLAVREVEPPFAAAMPSLVSLSHSTLWSFWSGQSREQLFRLHLEEQDLSVWRSKALDAALVDAQAAGGSQALQLAAVEGCDGRGSSGVSHKAVFTLYQQQEVWKAEEDGFDACQIAEMFESMKQSAPGRLRAESEFVEPFDQDLSVEDAVLSWWLGRVFLPGRFSASAIALALAQAGGRHLEVPGASSAELRSAVEEHLRRQAALLCGGGEDGRAHSHLQAVAALGSAAAELLRGCGAVWRRKHQVCGMTVSGCWGPHSWHPAGNITSEAYLQGGADSCPLLLCHGGVSCVRPVHNWAERWWATLHLSRDLSNHQSLELEDVLKLSSLDEWKLCTTAWFLSQCVGNSGISLALSLLRAGALPSGSLRRFAGDVPQHLTAHLSQCARGLARLAALRDLVQLSCCPQEQQVHVAGEVLDRSRGVWSTATSVFGRPSPRQSSQVCLSDVLRGSIAVGECEYLCSAMRDLLLLCLYVVHGKPARDSAGGDWAMQVDDSTWIDFAKVLDEQLPMFVTLHNSMQLASPGPEAVGAGALRARGCDLWAGTFRTAGGGGLGLRPPAASFKSFQYGMQLLRCGGWDAMRWWSMHQHVKEFSAYLAGRQWLANGRFDLARDAFLHAENGASIVVECLRTGGLQTPPPDLCPDVVCYYAHVAELFSSCHGPVSDQYVLLKKAALLAEESSQSGGADRSACQRLWSLTFEKAVSLEMWDEALEVLLRIDAFEGCLRLLGQRLRDKGKIDLILKLPEKHRDAFLNSLHEQALLGPPTPGSDSLACYQSLYALHFSNEEYLKASLVAHAMYAALSPALPATGESGGETAGRAAPLLVLAGDCISKPEDVPSQPQAVASGHLAPMDLEPEAGAAEGAEEAWPVLEQRRNALLMLVTALSLTPERLMLLPGPDAGVAFGAAAAAGEGVTGVAAGLDLAPAELQSFREWFAQAESRAERLTFTLADGERLLAMTEAQMILSGRPGSLEPTEVARSVASLGLLGLALQLAEANGLDPWSSALQPFLRLCLESDHSSDDKLAELASAARGPTLAFMFAQSDGCEPLGVEGSVRGGLWRMLDESLRAVCGPHPGEAFLSARGTQLYSLVAHEILSQEPPATLPGFLAEALSRGPSWVCLLRLYAKHARLEDAVDLLREQLKACKPTLEPLEWSPLQAFPVQLAVQLQRSLRRRVAEERSGAVAKLADELDDVLAQFRRALEDMEARLEPR